MRSRRHIRPAAILAVTVTLVAAATALAAIKTVSRTQAAAAAQAINLRHSDVAKLSEQANPITPSERQSNAKTTKCYGGTPDSDAYATAQSPAFTTAGQSLVSVQIESQTEILPSAADVTHDLSAIEQQKALACIASGLAADARKGLTKDETVTAPTVTRVASVLPGFKAAFRIRVRFTITVHSGKRKTSVNVYADEEGFAYGQAEVSMNLVETGQVPSTPLERALTELLLDRARAALGS
ncbi:MAG: hypothetical protein ABSC56_10240 [Solirubrobacteraceae bacterium]